MILTPPNPRLKTLVKASLHWRRAITLLAAATLALFTSTLSAQNLPKHSSALRQALPEATLMYFRLPVLSGALGANNVYLSDDQYAGSQKELEGLRRSFASALAASLDEEAAALAAPLLDLFVANMVAPLEIALVPGSNPDVPIPQLVLETRLAMELEALEAALTDLAAGSEMLQFSGQLDAERKGLMLVSGLPMQFHFDSQGHFRALVSAAAGPDAFTAAFTPSKVAAHPMSTDELAVDANGRGGFMWINCQDLIAMLQTMGAQEQLQQLEEVGLDSLQTLSLGLGHSNERGALLLNGKFSEPRPLLPSINNQFAMKSAGTPSLVANLSIPPAETLTAWSDAITDYQIQQGETPTLRDIEKEYKLALADIGKALGPEVTYIADDAGSYVAVKVRDQKQWSQLQKKLKKLEAFTLESRKYGGKSFHSLTIDTMVSHEEEDPATAMLMGLMMGKTRFYWTEENGHLLMSSLPQPVLERAQANTSGSVSNWLSNTQKQDFTRSVFAITGSAKDVSRLAYYFYLGSLLSVADASDHALDIYAFPTAATLGLPEESRFAAQLDMDPHAFSLQMHFGHSPMELMMQGSGLAQFAVIGILAAVAIPAYNDYIERAEAAQSY